MKLLNKGVLLIVIPILGQFFFVLLIVIVNFKADELARKNTQFRAQTQELISLSMLMYKSIGILSVYGVSYQPQSLKEFDSVYEQLQRKVELVSLMDQEKPTELSKRARNNFNRMMADIYSARQMLEVRGPLAGGGVSIILLVSDLRREIEDTLSTIEEVIRVRAEEGLTDVKQIETTRTLFFASIVSGFAVNMALCAYLLFRYSRDFARRFNIVVDNTSRIPQGLPLNDLVDGSDELTDLDIVFHDMDLALKEAQARKEQLMNMVSHDLRGPLTSALISFELLLNNPAFELTDKARKRIDETDKMVKRLSRLVNDVLDFDKLKIGKLDLTLNTVPFKAVLDECIAELQPLLEREELKVVFEGEDVDVIADRERLPQILINLISNAVKYSPTGSQIIVSADVENTAGEDANQTADGQSEKTEFVRISIQDQGPGVPELYRETIFLPFEQVPDDKRPKKGSTGLGLPICKMLVNLHGGEIGVDVPESGGSIFWFTLPLAEIDEL